MKKIIYFIAVALIACAAVACNKSENTETQEAVLSPLSEHIVGAWNMAEGYINTADGWVADTLPEDYRYVMDYRADGTIEGTLTENGHTGVGACPYEVDDSLLTIKQMWRTYHVEVLTADSLVLRFIYSPGADATDSIEYRSVYRKISLHV